MKIIDITEFYSERGGGIRSHLTTRGHVLCQLGHDHLVIAPGPRDDESTLCERGESDASGAPADDTTGRSEGGHERGRARVIRLAGPELPYDPTYHLLARFGTIRRIVRRERPDVLEAHSPYLAAAAIVACGRAAARTRTSFWHADHLGAYVQPALARVVGRRASHTLTRPLWAGVTALLHPFDATFVAGVSQTQRLQTAGVRNVVRTPFGVDSRTFHPGARSAERRRELAGDAAGPLLVGVGRFAIEKRWDIVLDAFARVQIDRLRQGRLPAVLVLFGDGPERTRLEQRAPASVRFVGFEKDRRSLASALASADLLVHGSPYETFGLGVAEGVACGLPVVVPDEGGAAESADPSCSETYRSLDPAACARGIERLLARDPSELRAMALEAAARVPTVAQHFGRVLAEYGALLDLHGKGRPVC
ncbi:MAG: glycosyltransferase [Myxococcota bacterium]|nr:glycosyltransferase [Myxococcota bacterium]